MNEIQKDKVNEMLQRIDHCYGSVFNIIADFEIQYGEMLKNRELPRTNTSFERKLLDRMIYNYTFPLENALLHLEELHKDYLYETDLIDDDENEIWQPQLDKNKDSNANLLTNYSEIVEEALSTGSMSCKHLKQELKNVVGQWALENMRFWDKIRKALGGRKYGINQRTKISARIL